MALVGKVVQEVEIKSGGDVFHELFRYKPHHLSNITPTKIQSCELHQGEWGDVGSIIIWNYTHDGVEKFIKEVVEEIDEEKKLIRLKMIEGDLMKLYKTFVVTIHVEAKGENNLVTWTFDYEKIDESIEDPTSLMDFCVAITRDIEAHHLN